MEATGAASSSRVENLPLYRRATNYIAAAMIYLQGNHMLEEPLKRVVCVMQGDEFFSTWVANKAIYRTRMALADDGEP